QPHRLLAIAREATALRRCVDQRLGHPNPPRGHHPGVPHVPRKVPGALDRWVDRIPGVSLVGNAPGDSLDSRDRAPVAYRVFGGGDVFCDGGAAVHAAAELAVVDLRAVSAGDVYSSDTADFRRRSAMVCLDRNRVDLRHLLDRGRTTHVFCSWTAAARRLADGVHAAGLAPRRFSWEHP